MCVRRHIPIWRAHLCDDLYSGRKSMAITINYVYQDTDAIAAATPSPSVATPAAATPTIIPIRRLTIASVHWLSDGNDLRRSQQLSSLLSRVRICHTYL
jgi:hypothetical protein